MSKVLVLGANGMLGHTLSKVLKNNNHELTVTTKSGHNVSPYSAYLFDGLHPKSIIAGIIMKVEPDYVINCIGKIKQKIDDNSAISSVISINSILPNELKTITESFGSKLIHISTDCVFSGKIIPTSYYTEADDPDATDIYGRTKILGEVEGDNMLTIRTSIIGMEQEGSSKLSLMEWIFKNNKKEINGYTNHFYNGLTTLELSNIINHIIEDDLVGTHCLHGIIQCGGPKCTKHQLVKNIVDIFGLDIKVNPYKTEESVNRVLDDTNFRRLTNIGKKDWETMLKEYKKWLA
jgi:dTDP-4-dehydrorhamnose reductase